VSQTNEPASDFDAALTKFIADAQALIDEHMARVFPNNVGKRLSVMRGGRYARIVVEDVVDGPPCGRSVFCFIDSTNGDILKSASWKAPAKGARGNIYTYTNVGECVSPYGAHHAR
jgi:hypothetical protein